MPRALALEGARRLQHEVVAVARADDLHAHRQPGAREADAHGRGRMPRQVERDGERRRRSTTAAARPSVSLGIRAARRVADRRAPSASPADRSARRARRTSALSCGAQARRAAPHGSGVISPRHLDAGDEGAAELLLALGQVRRRAATPAGRRRAAAQSRPSSRRAAGDALDAMARAARRPARRPRPRRRRRTARRRSRGRARSRCAASPAAARAHGVEVGEARDAAGCSDRRGDAPTTWSRNSAASSTVLVSGPYDRRVAVLPVVERPARDAAERGLQAEAAGEARRNADRAAAVAGGHQRQHAGRHRRRRAAARAARRAARGSTASASRRRRRFLVIAGAPNSGALVLPTTIAPAAFRRCDLDRVARRRRGRGTAASLVRGTGPPASSSSFTPSGMPSSGRASPRAMRASAARASAQTGVADRAASTTAFRSACVSSMRASTASISSTGEARSRAQASRTARSASG